MKNKVVTKATGIISAVVLLSACTAQTAGTKTYSDADIDSAISTGMPAHNINTTIAENSDVTDSEPLFINIGGENDEGTTVVETETEAPLVEPNPKADLKKAYKKKEQNKEIWANNRLQLLKADLDEANTLLLRDKGEIGYHVYVNDKETGNLSDITLITANNGFYVMSTAVNEYMVTDYNYYVDNNDHSTYIINPKTNEYITYVMDEESYAIREQEETVQSVSLYFNAFMSELYKGITDENIKEMGIMDFENDLSYIYESYDLTILGEQSDCFVYFNADGTIALISVTNVDNGGGKKYDYRFEFMDNTCAISPVLEDIIGTMSGTVISTDEEYASFIEGLTEYDWDKLLADSEGDDANNEDSKEDDSLDSVFDSILNK